ncbi:MAG: hypothetical protein PHG15_00855 [Acinetobacter sp.]|uniref:hypothetical protein n=1 Tax=Acinetobacter sp. TaxID=472 RepID=UPI002628F545|nr:hypothetical protein [Acinetobacter sp.]MDD2944367.1 hypothetical protein [Acinetobacter sp.]
MGLLLDWFLKNSEKNQVVLNYTKLNGLFVSQNGLYRNKDGSVPTIDDFKAHGFSEDEFFLAVYGKTQEEIQNRLMRNNAAKRGNRRKMINTRLAKNTKRMADSSNSKKKRKTARSPMVNEFALFAPFGVYTLGVRDGQFNNLIDQSFDLTGTAFGLFEMIGVAGFDNHGMTDNPLNDLVDAMNENDIDVHIHNIYGEHQDFSSGLNDSNDIF